MNRRFLALPAFASAVALGLAPAATLTTSVAWAAPAFECSKDAAIITHGHQDMALVGSPGDITTALFDDAENPPAQYDSGTFAVEVNDGRKQPLDAMGVDGVSGEGWVLPQTQEQEHPWLGFSTQHLDPAALPAGKSAQVTMEAVSAPDGGRVLAWQNHLVGIDVVMDTEDPDLSWELPANTHAHPAFSFTTPGVYHVRFNYALDGADYPLDVTFLVGDDTDRSDICGEGDPASPDPTSPALADPEPGKGGDSAEDADTTDPHKLAKGIDGITAEIGKLDKETAKTSKEADKLFSTKGDSQRPRTAPATPAGDKPSSKSTAAKPATKESAKSTANKGGTTSRAQSSGGGTTATSAGGGKAPASSAGAASAGGARAVTRSGAGGSTPSASMGTKSATSGKKGAASDGSGSKKGRDAAKKQGTKQAHGKAARGQAIADAPTGEQGGVYALDDAQQTGMSATKMNFWAGLLAGIGGFALVVGLGLLTYVQFFLPKKRGALGAGDAAPQDVAAEKPAQPTNADTTVFNSVD